MKRDDVMKMNYEEVVNTIEDKLDVFSSEDFIAAYKAEERLKKMGLISEYMDNLWPRKEQQEIYACKTMTEALMKETILIS